MIQLIRKYFISRKKSLTYIDFKLGDFLTDEFFKKWVIKPDEESSHFWDKWITNHPEKRKEVLQAKQIISSFQYQEIAELSDQDYTDMYEAVMAKTFNPQEETTSYEKKNNWLLNVAAILLTIVGITYVYYWFEYSGERQSTEYVETQQILTKESPKGIKTTLTLRDGTTVKLNAGSKLHYPDKFTDSIRLVELEGEAFFDVEKSDVPFIVKAGNLEAKVLGTSFNIQNNQEKNEIALVTGKLQVSDQAGNRIMLVPSEMVTYETDGQILKSKFDIESKMAWTKGILFFKDADGKEIFERLENWYGVEFLVDEKFRFSGKYSGTFKNESLHNVLEGIATTSGFHFEIKDKYVIVKPK
ncbi:MAG: anti-sigma factor [Thalassobius sp.]|nr:anti-sigma factor [Thalassovita sp.]